MHSCTLQQRFQIGGAFWTACDARMGLLWLETPEPPTFPMDAKPHSARTHAGQCGEKDLGRQQLRCCNSNSPSSAIF